VFCHVRKLHPSKYVQYLGQSGNDHGRDIWVAHDGNSYCYQCANYRSLSFRKAAEDIDKLVKSNSIPSELIVVCAGRVSAALREKIIGYATQYGIQQTWLWSGAKLEEALRTESEDLIQRFFYGVP